MTIFTLDSNTDMRLLKEEALDQIIAGKVILIPTETQYCLCCNSEKVTAMKALNRIKKRDGSIPTAVFVRNWEHASVLVENAPLGMQTFLNRFWPGPLTLVAKTDRPEWYGVVSESGDVGLRCSSHPFLRELVSMSFHYLTATSANVHGMVPSIDPGTLTNWLAGDIELFIFDPTIKKDAVPSTVISIAERKLQILREGAIEFSEIERVWRKTVAWRVV
ncbi:MAG: L-threonylcarbamoyladenylate synthase [candidate division Zixibacteria bacterium]|nr:L-threonylcarbamoyladenylate synthase [candidate division Zixibacteria bacterium]MBU1470575.1 L-threonylcarbamoyladenylate synthase [candidate division Zixibacteria bacterium]